jgi:hypothetical protein
MKKDAPVPNDFSSTVGRVGDAAATGDPTGCILPARACDQAAYGHTWAAELYIRSRSVHTGDK